MNSVHEIPLLLSQMALAETNQLSIRLHHHLYPHIQGDPSGTKPLDGQKLRYKSCLTPFPFGTAGICQPCLRRLLDPPVKELLQFAYQKGSSGSTTEAKAIRGPSRSHLNPRPSGASMYIYVLCPAFFEWIIPPVPAV